MSPEETNYTQHIIVPTILSPNRILFYYLTVFFFFFNVTMLVVLTSSSLPIHNLIFDGQTKSRFG